MVKQRLMVSLVVWGGYLVVIAIWESNLRARCAPLTYYWSLLFLRTSCSSERSILNSWRITIFFNSDHMKLLIPSIILLLLRGSGVLTLVVAIVALSVRLLLYLYRNAIPATQAHNSRITLLKRISIIVTHLGRFRFHNNPFVNGFLDINALSLDINQAWMGPVINSFTFTFGSILGMHFFPARSLVHLCKSGGCLWTLSGLSSKAFCGSCFDKRWVSFFQGAQIRYIVFVLANNPSQIFSWSICWFFRILSCLCAI